MGAAAICCGAPPGCSSCYTGGALDVGGGLWPDDQDVEGERPQLSAFSSAAPFTFPSSGDPRALEFQLEIGKDGLLGCSSIGTVVKTRHRRSNQLRALKRVTKRSVEGGMYKSEVQMLRQIDHPHICKVHDSWEDASSLYLVMELCEGGNLMALSGDRARLNEGTIAALTLQMVDAVGHLHAHKLVHGDIRPENWLFREPVHRKQGAQELSLKMIDFGLSSKHGKHARGRSSMASDSQSDATTTAGTPSSGGFFSADSVTRRSLSAQRSVFCRSPEQLRPGNSEKSDIWALGVISYFLLSGQSPFLQTRGVASPEQDLSYQNARFVFMPAEIWRPVSGEAKNFIALCLQKDPDKRPSASALQKLPWMRLAAAAVDDAASRVSAVESTNLSAADTTSFVSDTVATRLSYLDPPLPTAGAITDSFERIQRLQLIEKSAIVAAAHQLSGEDIPALRKNFQGLDASGQGVLRMQELLRGLTSAGVSCPHVVKMAKDLSNAGGAPIFYADFLEDVVELQRNIQDSGDWAAFKDLENGAGTPEASKNPKTGALVQEEYWKGLASSLPMLHLDGKATDL